MSNIRRQSIVSSIIVYFGFAMGFVNTYLFTKEGHFTETQYGLVQTFLAIAQLMCSVAALGMQSYIYKFYPYALSVRTGINDLFGIGSLRMAIEKICAYQLFAGSTVQVIHHYSDYFVLYRNITRF